MKKYGRKLVALFLATLFLVGIMPVRAVDMSAELVQKMSLNEFEYIEEIQSYSKEELMDAGMSEAEAEEALAFDYKEALYERAQLSEEKLAALGYTEDQIQILKDFAANPDGDYDFAATSSTIQGRIEWISGGSSRRKVRYTWNWSSMPLMSYYDRVGVRWQAIAHSGLTVDISNPPNSDRFPTNRVGTVYYYDTNGGGMVTSSSLALTYDSINKSLVADFPMSKTYSGMTLWAKSGNILCHLEAEGELTVNYVNFQATYGHKTLGGSIGISYSGGFGIAFTPSLCIENSTCAAKIYSSYAVAQ